MICSFVTRGEDMCKFQVSVPVRSKVEAKEAAARLSGMGSRGIPVDVSHQKKAVVAIFDHPTISCTLKMAGWVKDNFGMHPFFSPGVQPFHEAR